MPEVQNITQSFDINVGRRIRIKEDCISRDEFIGKTGRVLEAVPHIRIQLEEPIDYGNGTFGVVLLMPIADLEYIEEETEWEV
jgi:hypothetical protein